MIRERGEPGRDTQRPLWGRAERALVWLRVRVSACWRCLHSSAILPSTLLPTPPRSPAVIPSSPSLLERHCSLSPEQGYRRTAVNHRAWRSPFSRSRQRRKLSRSDAPVWNHQHFSYESLCNILPQALARRSLCFTSWLPPKNLLQTV